MNRSTILIVLLITCLGNSEAEYRSLAEEPVTQQPATPIFKCSQSAAEQEPLLREAIANEYWVRRVEFSGNQFTRDKVLRRRLMLEEGDVFTRENLVNSLKSLSRLRRTIYPVKLSDVILHLNRPEKIIDMTICLKEKPHHRGKRGSPLTSNIQGQESKAATNPFYLDNLWTLGSS